MAHKFRTLVEGLDPARQARIGARTSELLGTLPLNGLRKARAMSQEELADVLNINQATVSKLERRGDMYVSTVRRFVRAMGGELELRARFPEGVVEIDQFAATGESASVARNSPEQTSAKRRDKK